MKKHILLTASALLLVLTLCISLCACGSEEEVSRIESKGLFVLEQSENFDLSKNGELSEHEAYLIHVYDILPHETTNYEMSSFYSDYGVKLNDQNQYESVTMNNVAWETFVTVSGYALNGGMDEIYGGQDTIRAISVFKINKNDIHEKMIVNFYIADSDVYNCDMTFQGEDIQKIKFLDEIYNIEETPREYQLASTMYNRAKLTQNGIKYFWNNDGQNGGIGLVGATASIGMAAGFELSASGDVDGVALIYNFNSNDVPHTPEEMMCDQEEIMRAVDAIHPEISEATKAFFENASVWPEVSSAACEKGANQETYDKANNMQDALLSATDTIIEYFEKE